MKRQLLTLCLTLATAGAFAQHAERCDPIPKDEWKPQAELERKLKNEGWTISRVKIENGCYEVYGKNATGRKMETFFHPKTFEVVTAPK
ncbi:MAG: PepSY domain-containing protein [Burkholderiaceae bacterium]